MKKITLSDMVTLATERADQELRKQTGKGFITDKSDQDIIYDILDQHERDINPK